MKMRKRKLGLNYNIFIFQSNIPMPNFSFFMLSPRFPIKLGTGITFLVSPPPEIQTLKYKENYITQSENFSRKDKYLFYIGKNKFVLSCLSNET